MPRYPTRNSVVPALKQQDDKKGDVKQEDTKQEDDKPDLQALEPARRQRPVAYAAYDWASAFAKARGKAKEKGIVDYPPRRVGRVMEDGKLLGLFTTEVYGGARSFIVYDGFDVFARVQNRALIDDVILELVSLHIGRRAKTDRPDVINLVAKSEAMRDNCDQFCGWAVLIQPDTVPGEKRKADEIDQEDQNTPQKRRGRH